AQRRGAAAQAPAAKHEFGFDVGLAYASPSDIGGASVDGGLRVGFPLDVRMGWLPRGKLMFEGRLDIQYDGSDVLDFYTVMPGVNVVYPLGRSTHRRGTYLTGGLGLLLAGGGGQSGTGLSLNGAIGTRKPWGTAAALRLEGGVRYDTEIQDIGFPATLLIGGRAGISFYH
ncbi:MAG: hypothetical protein ACREMR_08475, partial [Gemmatimonadales bacterium]